MEFNKVDELRRIKKLSIDELCDGLGVTRQAYYAWMKTGFIPDKYELKAMNALNDGKPINNEARIIENVEWMEVEFLPIVAQAGYLDSLDQHRLELNLQTMIIAKESEAGPYLIIEVAGNSMNDGTDRSIKEGDKLLCKELPRDYWRNKLHYNQYLFVLMGRDGVVCKQITEHDLANARVRCHSYNELYKDYEVNLDELFRLYYVKKIVDRKVLI